MFHLHFQIPFNLYPNSSLPQSLFQGAPLSRQLLHLPGSATSDQVPQRQTGILPGTSVRASADILLSPVQSHRAEDCKGFNPVSQGSNTGN